MRLKSAQPTFATIYFSDGILSVPGYKFEKAVRWNDTGSMTILVEGSSLKDGSNVVAKIAPAQSNGSMCLEREAHILGRLSTSSEAHSTTLRLIEFFTIQRSSGDCVVLLLAHPGLNLLGRYFPPSKVNDLLLAEVSRPRPPPGDVYMTGIDELDRMEEMEAFDIMDLASFLEFAIQATHCLEIMHNSGFIHREVRANAFHLNSHSALVRLVHFGNRAISLEEFGGPSSLVIRAFEDAEKLKVKEALCYLAPEQTGSVETMTQDHRTDLYSLGILFWTLLVGRGQMPFEGGPLELLHSIVQKRPMPVHEVRRDVPQVLASIIDKLLAKSPDSRYQGGFGLKADLLECQRRLLATVSSGSDQSVELIPPFEIATQDRYMEFTMPTTLFGREKELDLIRNVIRHTSTRFSRQSSISKNVARIVTTSQEAGAGMNVGTGDDMSECSSLGMDSPSIYADTIDTEPLSATQSPIHEQSSLPLGFNLLASNDRPRRAAIPSPAPAARAQAVIVVGPPGVGKTSIILANQAKWRSHGLWGHAKFQSADSHPFAALLGCLSSVLRQMMVFHTDLHRFVTALKDRLGPQLLNVPLLYQSTPELRDVLSLFDVTIDSPEEPLATRELRARFQSLVENVFSVIAEIRLFALFLDDLHEADDSTLDLVRSLINTRSRMLIFATLRSDKSEIVERVRSMFAGRSRPTWINLDPLSYAAISSLVSKTLHQPREDSRNMLSTFQRQNHITFDWERNRWQYDMSAIESSLAHTIVFDPTDLTFLVSHLQELPEEARTYLTWATFFGETFKVTEVALMIEDSSSGSSGSEEELQGTTPSTSRQSMRGLQVATTEGWLIQRARDMCSFAHDRYRQAAQTEADALPQETIAKMSFKIVLMMMRETLTDAYRIAEYAKRCLPLLREHPKRPEVLEVLIDAGESAWTRGALELALQSFISARTLLPDDPWETYPYRTFFLLSRLAELSTWKGDYDVSDAVIEECYIKVDLPEDKAKLLRSRSRNHWMRSNFAEALNDNLLALHVLGIEVNANPTQREADALFEQVKNEILAVGFDKILSIPQATDRRTDLAVAILNDAGTTSYWSDSGFDSIIGLNTIQLALRSGMSPGTAIGFFWLIGAAAESRELYRFSADLAKLALRIAERHGTSSDKCRAQVLYCAMVSGFDSVHVRANLPRLEDAIKYGLSAGDRIYTGFASIHTIMTRLFVGDHLSELVIAAEESVADIRLWSPQVEDSVYLAIALLNCIRAIGGYTLSYSSDTVFDTDSFRESEYASRIPAISGFGPVVNWYNSFKVVGFYCVGYPEEAAELGFSVYETRDKHPNHRHVRYALFFHSLAMIACVRNGGVTEDNVLRYMNQIDINQAYIRKWLSPSPVNSSTWIALVDAELASLNGSPDAFTLYDVAVTLAINHDWPLEEGWSLYLQGCHFVRCGVTGLGSELQRRGISRQSQWGAQGIANHLTSLIGIRNPRPRKRPIFSVDVAVQTEDNLSGFHSQTQPIYRHAKMDAREEQDIATLTAYDLASILKWSKDISSDINLSSALQRLTEITTETSGSQNTCVVIAREVGDYTVATSMVPPDMCQVHENPKSVRNINDPLQKAIIRHALNTKERVCYDDVSLDSRFSSEAGQSPHRSVVCLPILSNRGQTFGAVYVASRYAFSQRTVTILTLLCQQSSIGIANALLFRSVQAGTRENLKMIATQKDALEAARKSREDALKATKIKSNFLASMSHELRTPFSSFYGLLDLLSGTELNPGQSEIVQTAKESCELLLKIIDSILDYSKLEASAVKLEISGFPVENIVADCMELLLPMATKKLDLSFNIETDVPPWVKADYARIRQVLMNLIGNAVKFTAAGSVWVICSVDSTCSSAPGEVQLKFAIHDTGIGLASSDVDLLFVPFQQADNSSTRRFGGTGLGLSISRQLVKLMGGTIDVKSELNVGSEFWFTIPVKIHLEEDAQKSLQDIEDLRLLLMKPKPLEFMVCSPSEVTLALLGTMLNGFPATFTSSIEETEVYLKSVRPHHSLDFIILDDQSELHADNLARLLRSLECSALQNTKIIHLYTPQINSLSGLAQFSSSTPGVVKITKPPRKARLLQTLAELKNVSNSISGSHTTGANKFVEDPTPAQRTLYGNVLVAEDNFIAQSLLVKQLERYQLKVTATENGNEAISEWESHEPGYFSVALFDHHMPICDGVEAAKRLRVLEAKCKSPNRLPIVALSADCQESTKHLCLSAGMDAFFSKPLKKGDLISLLSMFGTPPAAEP